MLYIQDESGIYHPAPKTEVLSEAIRLSSRQLERGMPVESSSSAKEAIAVCLSQYECEMFACLFLDSGHRVLAWIEMFRGSVNSATVHPREVVKEALQLNATAVIFAHNHPSGNSTPSAQDIALTKTLREILKVVDVTVLDHLVVGEEITALSDLGLFQ